MSENVITASPQAHPGPRVLITAGPTAEDIDPVRYITNRSTGRMGIEVAEAVARSGGTPLLVLGPTHQTVAPDVPVVNVRSASDMCRAVLANLEWSDCLVMTAAVADYTPAEPLDTKLKKGDGDLVLRLKRTPDILRTVMERPERKGRLVIGFSLDVGMNLDEGRRKLREKQLDMIVVNTAASFGADTATAWLVRPNGEEECGTITKRQLADKIVSHIISERKKP